MWVTATVCPAFLAALGDPRGYSLHERPGPVAAVRVARSGPSSSDIILNGWRTMIWLNFSPDQLSEIGFTQPASTVALKSESLRRFAGPEEGWRRRPTLPRCP